MESLINVSPGLFIWSVIIFGIVFFILSKFAFPAIIKALHDREEGINNAIISAEESNKKAQEILAESQAKLDNTQREIQSLLANGKSQAEKIIQAATEEANVIRNQKVDEAKKEIERNKENAISELRKEVADLVIMATEKVLEEKLDADKHKSLIEKYISNINKN